MIKTALFITILLVIATAGYSQNDTLLTREPDSLSTKTLIGYNDKTKDTALLFTETRISTSRYFALLGGNFKQILVKPFQMEKMDWKSFSIAAVIGGVLSFGDEPVQRFALNLRNENEPLRHTSSMVTSFGDNYGLCTLGALGAYSYVFKKEKMRTTALLASQAYITSAVLASALKFLTVRTRPSFYQPPAQAEPSFFGPFVTKAGYNGNRTNTSFPSGHTTSAFAIATVFAKQYKDHPWIPAVAYSAATLVGLSRITENKHWVTDVFAGATLGYLTGLQAVKNYRKHPGTKILRQEKKLSFNLQYNYGILMPGVVYKI
jgi:membrane-associated phospholipid phosphatase